MKNQIFHMWRVRVQESASPKKKKIGSWVAYQSPLLDPVEVWELCTLDMIFNQIF